MSNYIDACEKLLTLWEKGNANIERGNGEELC